MKFSVSQNELSLALSVVLKGIAQNSTLQVLSGIFISAKGATLTLESTDLNYSCKVDLPALIDEEGDVVVPGKLFCDVVRNLDDSRVLFEIKENQAIITCENTAFAVGILDSTEFPNFPTVNPSEKIELEFSTFQNLIKKVIKAASKDESNAVFSGVLVEVFGDKVRAVASDSYRIAIAEEKFLSQQENADFQVIVPLHFLNEICSLNIKDKKVIVGINQNQVVVILDNISFVNRKIEGSFPDYRKLLSANNETVLAISKQKLQNALKRMAILKDEKTSVSINVSTTNSTIQISLSSVISGSATEVIEVQCYGQDVVASYDIQYLMDGLSSINTNNVIFSLSKEKQPAHIAPCVFEKEIKQEDIQEKEDSLLANKFIYLIMPVFR